jgi:hypothetical protein
MEHGKKYSQSCRKRRSRQVVERPQAIVAAQSRSESASLQRRRKRRCPTSQRRGVAPLPSRASTPEWLQLRHGRAGGADTARNAAAHARSARRRRAVLWHATERPCIPPGSKRGHRQVPTLATLRYGVHCPRKNDPPALRLRGVMKLHRRAPPSKTPTSAHSWAPERLRQQAITAGPAQPRGPDGHSGRPARSAIRVMWWSK